ncbi:conserved exported hypothetical protein [Candidatus Desulfarcum epimagneticum]|uniref:Uncharacterized protein n=1 Tax=uncultured Desulfobacteraceae bacterium TaxID=218296 RepID=A0A484HB69_9BACT|nr:conserved exported hypothetical protein [uncultured Desulfobacteraceae bacterium]
MRRAAAILFSAAVMALAFSISHAREGLWIDADAQFEFAQTCFENSDYPQAAAEYKRFAHFFPKDPRVKEAGYLIALSRLLSDRPDEAIRGFDGIIDDYHAGGADVDGPDEWTIRSHLDKSRSLEAVGRYGAAALTLSNLAKIARSPDIQDEARYREGWLRIESRSWKKARESFGRIRPENRGRLRLESLSQTLEQGPGPARSPLTAGLLSVVPGLGQLYLGRYHDAAVAFFLNAALAWASWEMFENGLNAAGTLTALAGVGFYSGNIFSAAAGAHKHNRRREEAWIHRLKKNLKIHLLPPKDMRGPGLSITWGF